MTFTDLASAMKRQQCVVPAAAAKLGSCMESIVLPSQSVAVSFPFTEVFAGVYQVYLILRRLVGEV